MNNKWLPVTAGIIEILGGGLMFIVFAFVTILTLGLNHSLAHAYDKVFLGLLLLGSAVTILGGIFAIRREAFGLALAASIIFVVMSVFWVFHRIDVTRYHFYGVRFFPVLPSIISLVFTAVGKKAFRK